MRNPPARQTALLGWTVVLALGPILGCGSDSCSPSPTPSPLVGTWGGRGIQFDMAPDSAAVQYDCGHSSIQSAIVLDGEGRFEVDGSFVVTAGPEPVGGYPPHPARHRGKIDGGTMAFAVTLLDTGETSGPYLLHYGETGVFIFCR